MLFFSSCKKAACAWTRVFALHCLPLLFLHLLSPAQLRPVPATGTLYPQVRNWRHSEVKPIPQGQISNSGVESSARHGVVEEARCRAAVASVSPCPWTSAPALPQGLPHGACGLTAGIRAQLGVSAPSSPGLTVHFLGYHWPLWANSARLLLQAQSPAWFRGWIKLIQSLCRMEASIRFAFFIL